MKLKALEILKKPAALGALAGLVGIILGLLWGWYIMPVEWTDASPALLHTGYQEQYLRMAIDSYQVNQNADLAKQRFEAVGSKAPDILATIVANPGDQNPSSVLQFVDLVQPNGAITTPAAGGETTKGNTSLLSYLLIGVVVLVVGVIAYFLIRLLRPFKKKSDGMTPVQQAQQLDRETQNQKTNYTAMNEEPPIFQMLNTYVVGDDLYSHTFDVNSAEGSYLGQCGLAIADTIPVFDKPKRVRAIEVWLFGLKFNETTTAILMTPEAYKKESIREQMQKRGEPVMIEPNQIVEIETRSLKLHVRVADVKYGQGVSDDDSYYNRLTLELAAWPKVVPPE